jgi:hypothetical protein
MLVSDRRQNITSQSGMPLVCERTYKHHSANGDTDLTVRIWLPYLTDERPGYFRCEYEIEGLPAAIFRSGLNRSEADTPPLLNTVEVQRAIRATGGGLDSMNALLLALSGIHYHLKPFAAELTIDGDKAYTEMPLCIVISDPGRRRRIDDIVEEEEFAMEQRRPRLKRDLALVEQHLQSRTNIQPNDATS